MTDSYLQLCIDDDDDDVHVDDNDDDDEDEDGSDDDMVDEAVDGNVTLRVRRPNRTKTRDLQHPLKIHNSLDFGDEFRSGLKNVSQSRLMT